MPKPFENPPIPIDKIPVELLPDDKIPENVLDKIPVLPAETGVDIDIVFANAGRPADLLTNQAGDQGGFEGTFVRSDLTTDFTGSYAGVLGDVDGDGDLDYIEANSSGHTKLYTNQGGAQGGIEGTFVSTDLNDFGRLSTDVVLGDVDGDGDLDIVVGNSSAGAELLINQGGLQGGAEGDFVASDLLGFFNELAIGDLDGDGDLDLMAGNYGAFYLGTNQGGDDGGIEGSFTFSVIPGSYNFGSILDIALGDIDGDGDLDALFATQEGAHNALLTNLGGDQGGVEGTFAVSNLPGGPLLTAQIALGDVDGDGDLDALIANVPGGVTGSTGENLLLTNQGGLQGGTEGTFVESVLDGGSISTQSVGLADLDSDGDLDAVFGNVFGEESQLLVNQGGDQGGVEGEFDAEPLDTRDDGSSSDIAFGDVDGDGTVAAVDAYGFPNINLDGLLPEPPAPDGVVV